MGFSRQEYWSGLPFPALGYLSDPGIKPTSLTSPALADRFFTTNATWEAPESSLTHNKRTLAGNWEELHESEDGYDNGKWLGCGT